jgi:hypothetical protein
MRFKLTLLTTHLENLVPIRQKLNSRPKRPIITVD